MAVRRRTPRRGIFLVGLTTLCFGLSALLAAPSGIAHDPPIAIEIGKPLPIDVRVDGVPDGEPSVTVHYRSPGARLYQAAVMEPAGQWHYHYDIPASDTNST